jgi:UPF0176 protein
MAEAAVPDAHRVASGYRFAPVADPEALRRRLERAAASAGLLGTVLVAAEGVNLSLTGTGAALDAFEAELRRAPGFGDFRAARSPAHGARPFRRLKVRLRPEIVTLGRRDEPLERGGGRRVGPEEWHALLDDPAVTVVDVRNRFEVAAGSFPGAVDPGTDRFRDFPAWVETNLDPGESGTIAMCCTGGIRCEKVASWMRARGFEDVRELDGGILAYLESVPAGESRWQGDCFVFDDRVSLREALDRGAMSVCHGCRRGLTEADVADPAHEPGVCCPHCAPDLDAETLAARRERVRQVALARARGEEHLAPRPTDRPAQESGA